MAEIAIFGKSFYSQRNEKLVIFKSKIVVFSHKNTCGTWKYYLSVIKKVLS
jgi:hypothetical protein